MPQNKTILATEILVFDLELFICEWIDFVSVGKSNVAKIHTALYKHISQIAKTGGYLRSPQRTYAKGLSTKKTGSIRSYRYLSRGASGRRIIGETKGRTTAKT